MRSEGANPARGEVMVRLGGSDVKLCVTLGALARLEGHFGVSGFEALSERLGRVAPGDLSVLIAALVVEGEVDFDRVGVAEALEAVVAAFGAIHG